MGILDKIFKKFLPGEDFNKNILLMVGIGKVYSWDGLNARFEGGSGVTNCLTEFKNEIYEGAQYGINKFIISQEYIGEVIAERESVRAICSHNDSLYDASNGMPGNEKNEIRETLTNRLVTTREGQILDLASNSNDKLYDGGWYGIYETFSGKKIFNKECDSLCFHNSILYASSLGGIYDVFSNRKVAEIRPTLNPTNTLCSYENKLIDALDQYGIRNTLEDEIILTYDILRRTRLPYRSNLSSIADMISVNGLVYLAVRDGKQAVYKAIETEYADQLSINSVRHLFYSLDSIKKDVTSLLEPGLQPNPGEQMIMVNLLAEFKADPLLGVLHGQGRGHTFVKTEALRKIAHKYPNIGDYVSFLKKFFDEGYHIKRVDYVHYSFK
jgi:hypothetical protein